MFRAISSLLAFLGLAGCRNSPQDEGRPVTEIIASYSEVPIEKSINAVSRALARCEVLLPTQVTYQEGQPLMLRTSSDKDGRQWAYAYTNESELLAAFPKGCPYVKMGFPNAFAIVARDATFGGIFINREHIYLIPRDVFEIVQAELGAIGNDPHFPTTGD